VGKINIFHIHVHIFKTDETSFDDFERKSRMEKQILVVFGGPLQWNSIETTIDKKKEKSVSRVVCN
jgi:hypothetical protein